jgi:hypothetical protein
MRSTGLGMLVALALLVTSCSLATRDASLMVYSRNESAGALGYRLDYAAGGAWSRIETGSGGCADVRLPWTISVGAADRDGQVGDYHQLLSSGDVADPSDAEIWMDVAEDGSVTWGQGRPAWDEIGPLHCGPSD